jgi:hypothetical protein
MSNVALQLGASAAARYASVTYGASCAAAGNVADVQSHAAQNVVSIQVAPTAFAVTQPGCGCQVAASYAVPTFTALLGTSDIHVSARACFPA